MEELKEYSYNNMEWIALANDESEEIFEKNKMVYSLLATGGTTYGIH